MRQRNPGFRVMSTRSPGFIAAPIGGSALVDADTAGILPLLGSDDGRRYRSRRRSSAGVASPRTTPLADWRLRFPWQSGGKPEERQYGWLMSIVLGKSFRLTQHTDPLGHPAFTLEMG